MQKKTVLEKMTWLKDQRMIGRFRCENPSENQDLSTLINQVILALGKPEPLAKNKQTQEFFCQWYEDKQTECDGMNYQCNECAKIEKRADATSR